MHKHMTPCQAGGRDAGALSPPCLTLSSVSGCFWGAQVGCLLVCGMVSLVADFSVSHVL